MWFVPIAALKILNCVCKYLPYVNYFVHLNYVLRTSKYVASTDSDTAFSLFYNKGEHRFPARN
jgi:hypothetical protein